MNFAHFIKNALNCEHHIQLVPNDSVSFPPVYGANKVSCSCSSDLFVCDKKERNLDPKRMQDFARQFQILLCINFALLWPHI